MTQTQAGAIRPKSLAAFSMLSGNPGALVILLRHVGDKIFDRFILNSLPCTSKRKHKAPAAGGIGLVPGFDHVHIGLGTIGGITTYDDQLCPTRRHKLTHHLAKQDIFAAIIGMALRQNEAKVHRHTIAVPRRHQQHEAQPQKPGMMLAYTSFLHHRILGASFVGMAAIAKEIQDAVRRCWQGGHEILRQPAHEEMHVPIGGFEQASKAPGGDGGWRPPGHLFQGLAAGRDGLHEDKPAEYETMAPAPHRRHAAKYQGYKARQIGEGDQHVQSHFHRRDREKNCRWKFSCRLYTFYH